MQFTHLLAKKLGLNGKTFVFEILWNAIAARNVVQAKEISKFPANRRDLALVVADSVPAGELIAACKQAGGEKIGASELVRCISRCGRC